MWALLLPLLIVLLVMAASAMLDQAITLLMHLRRRSRVRQRVPRRPALAAGAPPRPLSR